MVLDAKARANLELLENSSTKRRTGSLLGVLQVTQTSMGARLVRSFIKEPLIDKDLINARLEGVDEFVRNPIALQKLRQTLHFVRDVERLTARVASGSLAPRNAKSLLESFVQVPSINEAIQNFQSQIVVSCRENLSGLDGIVNLLQRALSDDPPATFKEGGYIKSGFNQELDEYRNAKLEGASWIAKLEATEKGLTGIKNLKIGFNNNFGYFIEVLNSQKDLVPYRYVRKQTTTNAERYITDELKEIEEKILNADDRKKAARNN